MFEEKSNANKAAAADGSVITDDPEAVRSHAYELAFSSDDEMFQSTLYDWLIERGLADDLLEVRFSSMRAVYQLLIILLPDATSISRSSLA